MTDEPDNLTLKLLREIRAEQAAMREDISSLRDDMKAARSELAEARAERGEMRAEQQSFARLLGKVSDAVTEIAEIQANQGGRLNMIDGRLAIIEKRIGLVQA